MFFPILFALPAVAIAAPAQSAVEQIIASAIQHRICERSFWVGQTVDIGGPVAELKYKIHNGRAVAWSDDIFRTGAGVRVEERGRKLGGLFQIVIQGQQGYVFQMGDGRPYNEAVEPLSAGLGALHTMQFAVPQDCTPHPGPLTPWKARAIEKILDTMIQDGKLWGWYGRPTKLKVVIGDFDLDSETAHVYVPAFKRSLTVTFRFDFKPGTDITDLDAIMIHDDWQKHITPWVRPKILKYGLTRTINWSR